MKLLVVPVLALVASVAAPLAPAQAATATTSAVIVRTADNAITDLPPFSSPIVQGVSGGTVGIGGTEWNGRAVVSAHRTNAGYAGEDFSVYIPRKRAAGTYPTVGVNSGTAGDISVLSCDLAGTAVIRDVAWTSAGALTRLSMSLTTPCGMNGDTSRVASTSVEVRYAEPTASALIGEVEGPITAPAITTVVGTPVTSSRTFVNHGSGPATMGAAALAWQRNTTYPAFSILTDGCMGKTLQVAQSCDVVVRYAPQLSGYDQATLTVPDGRPRPAGVRIDGSATPQPDQPWGVVASGQLGSEVLTWYAPNVTTTNHTYDGYTVHPVDAAGVVGPIIATTGPDVHVAEITGLADRTSYGYVVEALLPGGAPGPSSVVVRDTTAGRLLLFTEMDGGAYVTSRGLDPVGHPYRHATGSERSDHLALSPDHTMLATSATFYLGHDNYNACRIKVLARAANAPATTLPEGDATCNSYPTFLTDTTLVFSRQDDVTAAASSTYLATYDLVSGVITPVPGGAGLLQPAVAPDGSIVAVDPVGHTLVRLADGTTTVIDNTAGAEQPAVADSGTIAFIRYLKPYNQRLTTVEADGSAPTERTVQDKVAVAPSWTGTTLYYAQENTIWRTTAVGVQDNVMPDYDSSVPGNPVVIDVPDTTGPVVTAPGLAAFSNATSLTFTVTAADPGPAGSGVASSEISTRSGPAGGTLGAPVVTAGSSLVVPLTSGQRYCLSARATDTVGNVGAWSTETCTISDRVLPLSAAGALPAFVLSSPVALTWSGTDTGGSGFASYDVRTDKAAASGGFSAWTTVLTHTTARSLSVALGAGSTTCVSVRGNDKAGNVGAWSAQRCTALPLDDRTPVASTGWTRVTGASFYARTASSSTKLGTTLVSGALQTSRLALVASKCSTCGTVGVYVGSTLVGKVNLAGATVTRAVMPLPRISLRSGKVTLKVLTSGKLVRIDGLATSRV